MARRAVAAWWLSLTLMFQKEVAERIVAQPGSDAYGRLSIAAQWRSNPKIAMNVNRSAFVPPPKVTSAVVHIVPAEAPAGRSEGHGAGHGGCVRPAPQDAAIEPQGIPGALGAAQSLGIDVQRRAETLSVDDFITCPPSS